MPVAFAVAALIPSMIWIARDRSIWPWDPSWYGEVSNSLWATLRLHPGTWPTAMVHAFAAKPPLIAWVGEFFVPFGYRAGNVEVSLLVSVILTQVATLVVVWIAARRLTSSRVLALVAAAAVGGAPLFVSMAHEYFVEPIQTAAVAWVFLIIVSAHRWRRSLTLAQLVAALAFGMLAKLSTPAYVVAPTLGALVIAFRSRPSEQLEWFRDTRVVASAIVALLLSIGAAGWYSVNFEAARAHADLAQQSGLYGTSQAFLPSLREWFQRFIGTEFLSWVWIAPLACIFGAICVAVFRRSAYRPTSGQIAAAAASAATVLLVLALFARQPNNDSRYLLPLAPALALLTVAVLAPIKRTVWPVVLAAALIAQLLVSNLQALGVSTPQAFAYPALRSPTTPSFLHELEAIVRQTCTPAANNRISIVGGDFPWLNANTLTMLAAEKYALGGRNCYYTPLGYAETDPNRAYTRLQGLKPPYYISLDYTHPRNRLPADVLRIAQLHDVFNRVNLAVYRRVLASGTFRVLPQSRSAGVIILRATPSP